MLKKEKKSERRFLNLVSSPGRKVFQGIEKGYLEDWFFTMGLVLNRPNLADLEKVGVDINIALAGNAA